PRSWRRPPRRSERTYRTFRAGRSGIRPGPKNKPRQPEARAVEDVSGELASGGERGPHFLLQHQSAGRQVAVAGLEQEQVEAAAMLYRAQGVGADAQL